MDSYNLHSLYEVRASLNCELCVRAYLYFFFFEPLVLTIIHSLEDEEWNLGLAVHRTPSFAILNHCRVHRQF